MNANLYTSSNILRVPEARKSKTGGICEYIAHIGEIRKIYVLVGDRQKTSSARSRCRREENVKINLREIRY
jgi:hypothetical protein